MLKGDMVVVGNAGSNFANCLIRGTIYIHGNWASLGHNTRVEPLTERGYLQVASLFKDLCDGGHPGRVQKDRSGFRKAILQLGGSYGRYRRFLCQCKSRGMRKRAHAGKMRHLRRSMPAWSVCLDVHTGQMHIQNYNACVGCRICAEFCPADAIRINPAEPEYISRYPWTLSAVEEVHYKAQTGEYLLRGFGTAGPTPNFDMITVVPSQISSAAPLDKYREECDMEVVIGEETCEKPVRLKVPFVWAAMSFGALSKEAKMALAIGAAQSGIATNTGEGGLVQEEAWLARGYTDRERKRKNGSRAAT
jgi:ferredoxin